jgi:hypothetical protein
MAIANHQKFSAFAAAAVATGVSLAASLATRDAAAAGIIIVTPGEQNTASAEFECKAAPCAAGHWFYYPEILQNTLGSPAYNVINVGDTGAVLGCDKMNAAAVTAAAAAGGSVCTSAKYTSSLTPAPNIAIIGPFGEHDQRAITSSAAAMTALYNVAAFQAAYDALVSSYLKLNTKVIMMTPIDLNGKWNAPALPAGKDLVLDNMLPAAKAVATKYNLPVVDTYTAITGTPALVTMYYQLDGQLNTAGQQKMAQMLLAVLMTDGGTSGGSGMSSGASTGASAGAGTGAATGASSGAATGSASGSASTGTAAGSGTLGGSGASATGSAASSGSAGSSGTGATTSGAAASGSASGSAATGTTVTPPGSGSGGNGSGVSGSGTAGNVPPATPSNNSGCSLVARSAGSGFALVALSLAALAFGRKRRR